MRKVTITLAALALLAGVAARSALADDGVLTKEDVEEIVEKTLRKQNVWSASPKTFKELAAGGRLHFDWWFFGDPQDNWEGAFGDDFNSGVEFRRARLFFKGKMWDRVQFKAEYDFADQSFKDVYMGLYGLDECWGCLVPDIIVGHMFEPMSLDQLTTTNYTTFMEWALPVTCFLPERNPGVMVYDHLRGDTITYAFGLFLNDASDDFGSNVKAYWDDGYAITGRITWLPWAPCGCEYRFLEVGVYGSYRGDLETSRFRTRPECHLAPYVVDTGSFASESEFRYGAEVAFEYDRFSAQAEYIAVNVNSDAADDPNFYGYYGYVSYFLNGPARNFNRAGAVFDRVKPCKNFLGKDCCGWGAWEVAARYSYVNLNDGNIDGGALWDITVGLNWYLNPNSRVMFNYVHSEADEARRSENIVYDDGSIDMFGMRFQVDF